MKATLPLVLGGGSLIALLLLTAGSGKAPVKPPLSPAGPLPIHPPLPGVPRISSRYGWRTDPVDGSRKFHAGIDLPVPIGTAVFAPQEGRVARIDRAGDGERDANGNAVFIAIGSYRWCFLHLSTVLVDPNQTVQRGQVIAFTGNTGKSTGPHLHLQIYDAAGATVDPERFFPPGTFANGRIA
jgi:murein DD-endopeptidase MepM/ murein hydrolase activator NlpD